MTLLDDLINDSRLSTINNGDPNAKPSCSKPSSATKWWFSLIMGILFFIISSPLAYLITNGIITGLQGRPIYLKHGPNILGLILHSILFLLLVRIILW